MISTFYEFAQKLLNTSSRIGKEAILKEYKNNQEVKDIIKILLDDRMVFGIQMKKLEKAQREAVNSTVLSETSLLGMLKYVAENKTGTDKVLSEVASYIQAQEEQYHDMLAKIFTKNLKLGITANTVNKIWGKGFIFQLKVMRSKSYEKYADKLKGKEVIVTIKVDGIRMVVIKDDKGVKAYSRSGKEMLGYEHILNEMQNLPNGMYDGEVVVKHRENMQAVEVRQQTASLANTKEGDRTNLEYIMFDFVTEEEFKEQKGKTSYAKRRMKLKELTVGKKNISVVTRMYQGKEFDKVSKEVMQRALDKGEEGLMVANAKAVYQFKQTDHLQKMKPSYSIDLRVVDTYSGLTLNTADTLGGAIVTYKGNELKVGNGWSEDERKLYHAHPELLIGKIIEIEHNGESRNKDGGYGVNFPRFVRLREDKDEESYE